MSIIRNVLLVLLVSGSWFGSAIAKDDSDRDHDRRSEHRNGHGSKFDLLAREIQRLRAEIAALERLPGPQGPAGPSGPTGPTVPIPFAGLSCPSGMSVTGFDVNASVICSDGVQSVVVAPGVSPGSGAPPNPPQLVGISGPFFGAPAILAQRYMALAGQFVTDAECQAIAGLGLVCLDLYTQMFADLGLATVRGYQVSGISAPASLVSFYASADCSGGLAGGAAGIRAHVDQYLVANNTTALLNAMIGSMGSTLTGYLDLLGTLGIFSLNHEARIQVSGDGNFVQVVYVSDAATLISATAADQNSPESACASAVMFP